MLGVHGVGGSSPPSPITKTRLRELAARMARERSAVIRGSASSEILRTVESSRAWRDAQLLLCYMALASEVATWGLMALARERGCAVAVPRVVGGQLRFYAAPESASGYVKSPMGVLEPSEGAPALEPAGSQRALVLVPGLFFDLEGYRLGRGGGHYDRFIARARLLPGVTFMGLCFDEQLVARLPRDHWDERVDAVVTERRGLVVCGRPAVADGPAPGGPAAP